MGTEKEKPAGPRDGQQKKMALEKGYVCCWEHVGTGITITFLVLSSS